MTPDMIPPVTLPVLGEKHVAAIVEEATTTEAMARHYSSIVRPIATEQAKLLRDIEAVVRALASHTHELTPVSEDTVRVSRKELLSVRLSAESIRDDDIEPAEDCADANYIVHMIDRWLSGDKP